MIWRKFSVSDIPPSFAEITTPTTHPGAAFQITKEKTDLQKPPLQNQVQIQTKTGRTPKPTLLQINPIQSKQEKDFPPIPTATAYIWLPYLGHGGSNPPQRTPNNTEHRPQTYSECSTLHPQEIHPS
ncbi:hypothetical protein TNCT_328281 [Trichonephila clavata]|uniref:Uncharacterized protein n=1 Tax=Trichonephila clavata TaxID=2740835 RepID=A0A8X6HVT5_TRICU|nr:hypothetical protein TNCT_328281 [Trichonephila clavata]